MGIGKSELSFFFNIFQDANGQNTHQAAARKRESLISPSAIKSLEERQKIVEMAKISIQNRRSRRIQVIKYSSGI